MTHIARAVMPVALLVTLGLAGCSATSTPHQEPAPSAVAESPTPSATEEAPAPAAGTRENPIPVDTLTEYDPASMWRFSVGATNPDATADVIAQNQFNTVPAGSVFITAPLYLQVKPEGDPNGADPISSLLIEYVSAKGNSFQSNATCVVNDAPWNIGTMYPGAEGRGTICAAVPADAVVGGAWKVTSIVKPDTFIFLDGAN
ncbi:hypothetical protein [Microbacterium hydrocarbonoxydans]|uniref:hypothetical protein n=1 Tax=Microbacterium hydrocarbonoxydans TaxID=273678 RepID=UPI00203BB296|nr:hypothetical protein [Microbacterium hydrocarbonoxydans]MCM3778996.1 hypothetical protein [Microbacterium hydrocarbonoxydans]